MPSIIAFRPEASVIYVNADGILESVLRRVRACGEPDMRLVVCDLSASPYIDLAGCRMLHDLHDALSARGISLRVVGAHSFVRDLLRADGLALKIGGLGRVVTLEDLMGQNKPSGRSDDSHARGTPAAPETPASPAM
jgi:sulfate permease, SulP family